MTIATDGHEPGIRSVWTWVIPVTCGVLLLVDTLVGAHREIVIALNGWQRVTGRELWANITVLGDSAVACALLLPAIGRRPRVVFGVFLALLLCLTAVKGIELSVPMKRPPSVLDKGTLDVIGPARKSNSFPSGHTLSAFIVASFVLHLTSRRWIRLAAVSVAVLVGLSRMVVGVHWPADVLAGAGLGWLVGLSALSLAGRWSGGLRRGSQLVAGAILGLAAASLFFDRSDFDHFLPVQLGVAAFGLVLGAPRWVGLLRSRAAPAVE